MTDAVDLNALLLGVTCAAALVVVTAHLYVPPALDRARDKVFYWQIRHCKSFEWSYGVVQCECGRIAVLEGYRGRFEIEYASCPLWRALKEGKVRSVRLLPERTA